ncbi:inner membrane metabolite transport protein YdjE [Peptococcaceae bacterium CEB3]|nr:inner membrane metabolite transport protein YdjE [Peptococcaceae bacterium CEB3]
MGQVSVASRLNRLPVTRTHKMVTSIVGIGIFFDLFDIFLAGILGTTLTKQFHLNAVMLPIVIGSGFIGMFFGALLLGRLGDKFGRRSAYLINLGLYSLFTFIGAFSFNASMLIVSRFIAGLGIGAEPPLSDTYMSEMYPSHSRGRLLAWTYTISFLGIPAAGFLSMILVPMHPFGWDGWRWVFVIGSLGAAIVWILRSLLPESPRWLESVGRVEEAEAITAKMETEAIEKYGNDSLSTPKAEEVPTYGKFPFRALFSKLYLKRTIMLWIFQVFQSVGYYGFGTIVPMVLVAKGYSVVHSLTYTALSFIGYPIGSALSLPIMERLDRKWLITGSAFLMGVLGISLGYSSSGTAIVLFGFLYTLVSNIFSNGYHLLQAEIFPTYARSTATGTAYSLSRLSSGLLPFVLLPVLKSAGAGPMFGLVAFAMLIVIVDVGFFAPQTTGLALEIVNSEK